MRALMLVLMLAACSPPIPAKSTPPPPVRLAGSNWVMLIEDTADGAPTLQFEAGSRAGGFTGCNSWFAQVDRRDGGLRFEAIGMTRRACDQPAMALEHDFADLLAHTRGVTVEGDVLTLLGEDGATLARFERTVQGAAGG